MQHAKYRAWDGETFYLIDLNNAEELIETMPGYLRTGLELQPKQFFTGLKDKNGKDIYEGDLYITRLGGKNNVYQVFFSEGAFVGGKTIDNCSPLGWPDPVTDWLEIIGNIHENPELLTVPSTQV